MLLSDMGADVIRVDRADAARDVGAERPTDFVKLRGRPSIAVDLKQPAGPEVVLRLAEQADAFIEGFRPGVVDRLGIGPEACRGRNSRLVYAHATGWGQSGPLAHSPGHDINYLALSTRAGGHIGRVGVPQDENIPASQPAFFGNIHIGGGP